MIKKIVTLSVSFVLGFVAIFFSVHASAFSGKGNGKNASLKNPKELAGIIASIPKSADYSNENGGGDGEFTSLTLHDSLNERLTQRQSTSYSLGTGNNYYSETTNSYRASQEFDIYFTSTAAYYSVEYKAVSETSSSERKTVNGESSSKSTESLTSTELNVEYYISAERTLIKYNKYNIITENSVYADDELVENDSEKTEDELIADEMVKTIRSNYGKWIELNYTADFDFDINSPEPPADFTEDDMYEALLKSMCVELGVEMLNKVTSVNDMNIDTLKKIGNCLEDYDNSLAFKKSGNYYKMTDVALKSFISSLATNMKDLNYNSSSFVVNFSDKTSPVLLLDVGYYWSNSSSGSDYDGSFGSPTSSSVSFTHGEEVTFTNIDNTVLPNIPKSAKNLYDFIGKALLKIIKEQA